MKSTIINIFILLFYSVFTKIIEIPHYDYYDIGLNLTIKANLTKYLKLLSKNNSEIENKTIYSSYKELKEVKIAVLEGTIFKKISENLNLSFQISEYKSRKEIIDSLRNKKIEAYITTLEEAQNIIMYNDDIAYIKIDDNENVPEYQYSFVAKNENGNTLSIFQSQYEDYHINYEANYYWNGFDESLYNINKTRRSDDISKKIKIGLRMDEIPFSYNNSKGELTGYAVNHIYRTFDNVELLEFKSNEELIEAVQKGIVNVSAGYFSEKENKNKNYTDISFFYSRYKLTPVAVIRYENSNSSNIWKINSYIKHFKNKKLGILGYESENKKILNDSTKKLLNISNNRMTYESYLINNLYISLLKEEIDAIIIDKPIAEYYSNHFDKLTYISESISNNSYGIGFFNETLKNEFNEFLSNNYNESQLNTMLDNWINNENYEIDKDLFNLNGTRGTIKYLLDSDKKPIAFLGNEMIPKGFEFELIYSFAKEYGYKIEYDGTKRHEGTLSFDYDIYLGCLIIGNNYEVGDLHLTFSNPIYKSSTVLAVKTKNKKDYLTIQILDEDYNYKSNNDMRLFTRVLYKDRNTSCIFPKEYNDTIVINCSIPDFVYDVNGTMTGFDFLNTSDVIKITYSTIKPYNFLNADLIFKDIENIGDNDDEENKEDEDGEKGKINHGNKSSSKSITLVVIIAIIALFVLILLIIIIICVVRKIKNKADNAPVKIADNSNASNEISMGSGTSNSNQ